MVGLLAVAAAAIVAVTGWALVFARVWFVWFAPAYRYVVRGARRSAPLPPTRYTVTANDGVELHCWSMRGELPAVVIVCGGYRCFIEESMPVAADLNVAGFNVVALQWRGCGSDGGGQVTWGVREMEDLAAVIADTRVRQPGMRVAVHGLSFGASMAVFAAAREPVDALWVDGPFSDPLSVMADAVRRRLHLPGGLWVWPVALVALASRRIRIWNVRTGDVASRLSAVPVRVLVYPDDNLVPIRRSFDICRQAGWRDNCKLMYGMGHASAIDSERVEYIAEAASFYRATLLQGSADLEGSADRSVLGTPVRPTGARRTGPTIAR